MLALTEARLNEFTAKAAVAAGEAARILAGGVDQSGQAQAVFAQGVALGRASRLAESLALCEEAVLLARAPRMPRLIGGRPCASRVLYRRGPAITRALAPFSMRQLRFYAPATIGGGLRRSKRMRAELLFSENDLTGGTGVRARGAEARLS